jgi:predicted ABC-type ATPase
MPVLHLIAGPNGAGKSTLYRYLIHPRYPQLPFVNADLYEREQLGHIRHAVRRSEAARTWADIQRKAHLDAGEAFVSETVFSHPS